MQTSCFESNNIEEIVITEHAYLRMRQRNGWSKKTANRMIKRIYVNGLRPEELKGYKKKWIIYRKYNGSQNDEYVLYGDHVYIFNGNVLITSYQLPCREQVMKHYKTR